jgi:hypothetical protein
MTRAAIRPAKSFWKNVQPWRTTCQWLCQRTRLVMPGISIRFATISCAKCAAGRTIRNSIPIRASCQPASRQIVSGVCDDTSDTMRPMHSGISASVTATKKQVPNSAAIGPGIWRTKCQ